MSSSLDPVVAQIEASNSGMNLYRNFSQNDRITLNSTPCDQNSTGSCRGLVTQFTPAQFNNFDVGRVTTQTIAQLQDCVLQCMIQQSGVLTEDDLYKYKNTTMFQQWYNNCNTYCDKQTSKDFI